MLYWKGINLKIIAITVFACLFRTIVDLFNEKERYWSISKKNMRSIKCQSKEK